jgi:tRNA(Ile)-lysidine synthetase-like protein
LFAIAGPKEDTTPAQPLVLELGAAAPVGGLRVSLGKPEPEEWERQRRREQHPWEAIRRWPEALDQLTASPPVKPVWRCFLPGQIELPLVLRAWRAADRIALPGGGTKKVGDIFTDAKVPACFRPVWGVVAGGDEAPLWVPGLADSAAMRLPEDVRPAFVVSIRESR